MWGYRLTRRLLTIYDLEVEAKWEGKTAEGEDVKGTLRIPEFSHEAIDGLSDYVVRCLFCERIGWADGAV